MEEAAFMRDDVIEKVVIPLITMRHCVLIAISTPDGEENFYSVLLEKRHKDGSKVFKTITIGLICDNCKAAKRGASCTHLSHLRPLFHSSGNRAVQEAMSTNKDRFSAEQMGQVVSTVNWTFPRAAVEAAFTAPPVEVIGRDGVIFVGVDPSGGSAARSRLAIVAWVWTHKEQMCIIGLESLNVRGTEDQNVIVNFITALRNDARYRTAWIVSLVECNLTQNGAAHYNKWIKEAGEKTKGFGGVWTVGEQKHLDEQIVPGLPTTNPTKRASVALMYAVFEHKKLVFDSRLIGSTAADTKKLAMQEFASFQTEEKTKLDGPNTYTVSAKKTVQDDNAMAMMFSLLYACAICKSAAYIDEVEVQKRYNPRYLIAE
jgi:hypothetical protein